jgi:hypothetical protein
VRLRRQELDRKVDAGIEQERGPSDQQDERGPRLDRHVVLPPVDITQLGQVETHDDRQTHV